ncbi:uncharacterized protein [Lolium perenne]|uniref:uncharacterized protein n=1 Tax=Lolium perenne TaxID=4522 RepID=UPI0021F694F4|nr:uncharacterized protein LOC127327509 [Lolium perenne]
MASSAMIGRERGKHEDGAVAPGRRRFQAGSEEEEEPTTATAGCRCRSCAAVAVADCVALGCCPCAVVGLLGLALVRAPLAVGRRLIRRRRRALLRGKRVRDVAAATVTGDCVRAKGVEKEVPGVVGGVETLTATTGGDVVVAPGGDDHEAELAWLEEMYRTGRWGFGRVSFSAKTP